MKLSVKFCCTNFIPTLPNDEKCSAFLSGNDETEIELLDFVYKIQRVGKSTLFKKFLRLLSLF